MNVATARKGAGLPVLGEFKKPIQIQLGQLDTKFSCQPIVLEGLTHEFNLAGPFMKQYNIDQLHSRGALRVQGQRIPLIGQLGDLGPAEDAEAHIFTQGDCDVPPMTSKLIPAVVPAVKDGRVPAEGGLVQGSVHFMEATDLHPWRSVMASPSPSGALLVGIMNTTADTIRVPGGSDYGTIKLSTTPNDRYRYPWRICLLGKPESDGREAGGPTPAKPGLGEKPLHGGAELSNSQNAEPAELPTWMRGPTTRENAQQRLTFLMKKFKLRDSEPLRQSGMLKEAALLLLKHWDVFSFDGSFGHTHLLKHHIRLEPGTRPINQKYRPVNPTLEPDLKRQLDKWLDQGLIKPTNSPWNASLVAVPKKNGNIRWCLDYRALNAKTVNTTIPIGHIEDNLVRLSRSQVFSCIDGCGAFHVVELEEKDKEVTAFATPWGSYAWEVLPFGLCGGPSTYARLVQMVLAGIPSSVALPFLDDTCVHSKDVPSHLAALDQVLTANAKAGLKLQPDKCSFFRTEVQYLGHRITKEGISPMPEYIELVQKWPLPKNRHEVRVFLGKSGYYRKFVKDYAAIAKPLTDLLADNGQGDKDPIKVTPEILKSFETLKAKLLKPPILAYPRFDSPSPFILDTDWSCENRQVGATLSQVQDGKERVIAYAAKKLSKSQCAYSSCKGELSAAIIFMRHWSYYLKHRKFILRTDNTALKWIYSMEHPTGMMQRYLHTLANYQFDVQHRSGRSHGNADSASRAPHVTDTSGTDISMGEMMGSMGPTTSPEDPINPREDTGLQPRGAVELAPMWTPEFLQKEQREDPEMGPVFKAVEKQTPPSHQERDAGSAGMRLFYDLYDSLYLDEEGVLRLALTTASSLSYPEKKYVVVVPKSLHFTALKRVHDASGHVGRDETVRKAQRVLYFPNMSAVAMKVIHHCEPCQKSGGPPQPQKHSLHSHQEGLIFNKISMDHIGPLTPSHNGNRYILSVKCLFSRWVEAFPVKRADAQTVVEILEREIIPRWGLMESIHTDRHMSFRSDIMHDVAAALQIRLTTTPAYNPRSNPVERAHRDLAKGITSLTEGRPQDWEKVLPQVLFALRTAKCRSTGFAPFELVFGRHPSLPIEHIFGSPQPDRKKYRTYEDYAEAVRMRFTRAHAWARENLSAAVERQRRAYYKSRISYTPGDKVWLFTPRVKPGESTKWRQRWSGPWTVRRKINDVMYQLTPDPRWDRVGTEVVSIDRMKKFFDDEDPRGAPPDRDADLTMTGDEFAQNMDEEDDLWTYQADQAVAHQPDAPEPAAPPHPRQQPPAAHRPPPPPPAAVDRPPPPRPEDERPIRPLPRPPFPDDERPIRPAPANRQLPPYEPPPPPARGPRAQPRPQPRVEAERQRLRAEREQQRLRRQQQAAERDVRAAGREARARQPQPPARGRGTDHPRGRDAAHRPARHPHPDDGGGGDDAQQEAVAGGPGGHDEQPDDEDLGTNILEQQGSDDETWLHQ